MTSLYSIGPGPGSYSEATQVFLPRLAELQPVTVRSSNVVAALLSLLVYPVGFEAFVSAWARYKGEEVTTDERQNINRRPDDEDGFVVSFGGWSTSAERWNHGSQWEPTEDRPETMDQLSASFSPPRAFAGEKVIRVSRRYWVMPLPSAPEVSFSAKWLRRGLEWQTVVFDRRRIWPDDAVPKGLWPDVPV